MPVQSPPDLRTAVAALPAGDPSTWSAEQAMDAIPGMVAMENQLAAWKLASIAKVDAAQAARALGHRTTADWLGKTTRMTAPGEAVHMGRDLRDVLPVTSEALQAGLITVEQVRQIRRAYRLFDDFTDTERTLVEYAKHSTAREVRALVDLMVQQYAPDGSDEDAEKARDKRELFLSQGLGGWWHLKGLLDPATGEKLKAALDVLSDKCGPEDDREAPARRADALGEMADRAMDPRSTGHGHLLITLTPQQAESKLGVTWPSGGVASRTDASVETCTAEVSYAILDPVVWQPLAVGFAERFATPAQRRALIARDGNGCGHPGCTVPAWRTVAHHIVSWDAGGPTNLPNLVLLCRYHHREVHRGKLRVVFQEGRATTIRGDRAPP